MTLAPGAVHDKAADPSCRARVSLTPPGSPTERPPRLAGHQIPDIEPTAVPGREIISAFGSAGVGPSLLETCVATRVPLSYARMRARDCVRGRRALVQCNPFLERGRAGSNAAMRTAKGLP